MNIINGTSLSDLCDYSFGDHMGAASIPRPKGGFMKLAHPCNNEFAFECEKFESKVMTLFIDNIRLYNRPLITDKMTESDARWISYLQENNDLMALCATFPKNKFVIFCSHEDTPIDSHIRIPENVLGIHAVNAQHFNDKIHPFPYGLQRELGENDNRLSIMKELVEKDERQEPTKLLYINCGLGIERNSPERAYLVNFEGLPWTTCRFDKDSKFYPYNKYKDFLTELKDHKFMICPEGHGIDCHRNWESFYMRRVPVMKLSPYFTRLMRGFPVLFVDKWEDVTEKLLLESAHLYDEAQRMNLNKLDLNLIFKTIVSSYETHN